MLDSSILSASGKRALPRPAPPGSGCWIFKNNDKKVGILTYFPTVRWERLGTTKCLSVDTYFQKKTENRQKKSRLCLSAVGRALHASPLRWLFVIFGGFSTLWYQSDPFRDRFVELLGDSQKSDLSKKYFQKMIKNDQNQSKTKGKNISEHHFHQNSVAYQIPIMWW